MTEEDDEGFTSESSHRRRGCPKTSFGVYSSPSSKGKIYEDSTLLPTPKWVVLKIEEMEEERETGIKNQMEGERGFKVLSEPVK